MKPVLKILAVIVTVYSFTILTVSGRTLEQGSENGNGTGMVSPIHVRCYNTEGNVPDPGDCSSYFTCAPAPNVGPGDDLTYAVPMQCPPGGDDGPLYYNFRNCTQPCQRDPTGCFKPRIDDNDFLICTVPFVPEAATSEDAKML